MRSLLQHFQKQRLHHVCFIPFLSRRVLVIKLVFNKHSLLWFFPWRCAGFSFASIFSGIFLISLRLSLSWLGWCRKCSVCLPWAPRAPSSHGDESPGCPGLFSQNRGHWLLLCCVRHQALLMASPTERGKWQVEHLIQMLGYQSCCLRVTSQQVCGNTPPWKEHGSMSNPRESQIVIIYIRVALFSEKRESPCPCSLEQHCIQRRELLCQSGCVGIETFPQIQPNFNEMTLYTLEFSSPWHHGLLHPLCLGSKKSCQLEGNRDLLAWSKQCLRKLTPHGSLSCSSSGLQRDLSSLHLLYHLKLMTAPQEGMITPVV